MTAIPIRDESHWRELRQQHVGGSEIAALFDCCPYLTRLELWLIKRGEIDGAIADTDRMFWGRLLEDAIAQGVAKKTGWIVENPAAYYICRDTKGMGCTPDRIIRRPDAIAIGLMQIKCVDRFEYRKWENGEPSLMYQLQLQHELACAGYSWGMIAALIGGNELKLFEYEAHGTAILKIKKAVDDFWFSVREGIQPPAVAEDYDTLREIAGQREEEIDLSHDNELPDLCARAKRAAKEKSTAEQEEKACKATIVQKLGGYARARCSGFTIKASTVNKESYTVKAQSYKQLTIKEEKAA